MGPKGFWKKIYEPLIRRTAGLGKPPNNFRSKSIHQNHNVDILIVGGGFSGLVAARKLIDSGVTVALATDFNPGSCNIQSMPFIISLACLYLKMNILDAVKACTYTSAKSLMLEDTVGSIEEGKKADLIIWDINKIEEVSYSVDFNPISCVIKNGTEVFIA